MAHTPSVIVHAGALETDSEADQLDLRQALREKEEIIIEREDRIRVLEKELREARAVIRRLKEGRRASFVGEIGVDSLNYFTVTSAKTPNVGDN